jgi:tetratricopeptide (TPR) repeat protein
MSEPVMSPDGKHMWTGKEWITAPPGSSNNASVSLQDSVVTGDINTEINYATTINKNIINDNETTIRSHMKSMIENIKSGNSAQAFEIYERAKQIDFELAKGIYEKEFYDNIVSLLYNNAFNFCESVIHTKFTAHKDSNRGQVQIIRYRENYNVAVNMINDLINLSPNYLPSYFLMIKMVQSNGIDFNKVARLNAINVVYEKILKIDSRNHEAKVNLERNKRLIAKKDNTFLLFSMVMVLIVILFTIPW